MPDVDTGDLLHFARAIVAMDDALNVLDDIGLDHDESAVALVLRAARVEIAEIYEFESTALERVQIGRRLHSEADAVLALPPLVLDPAEEPPVPHHHPLPVDGDMDMPAP